MGCDHTAGKAFAFRHISIHAPQWGATTLFKGASGTVQFQSTHPSGVRPRLPPTCSTPLSFQSTHPSGVRLAWRRNPAGRGSISIHAPQWGATFERGVTVWSKPISIHAPQWGATLHTPRCGPLFLIFQSTHPSGVRPDQHAHDAIAQIISIHAPQWGATGRSQSAMSLIQISIHAPQWGATQWPKPCTRPAEFQSTHPSGVRPGGLGWGSCSSYISIHAPQWGATSRRL